MKKSVKSLLILTACAVLLGGALLALKLTEPPAAEETSSGEQHPEEAEELLGKAQEDIAFMLVENENGSYRIAADKIDASGELCGVVDALEGIPVSDAAIKGVLKSAYRLPSERDLGPVENLNDYGLQNPAVRVEVTLKNGESFSYKIGNVTPGRSDRYYAATDFSDHVYLVSALSGFLFEPVTVFVDRTVLTLTPPEGASVNDFTRLSLSGKNYPEPVSAEIDMEKGDYRLVSPISFGANASALQDIFSSLESLSASGVSAVHPEEASLRAFGLDSPDAVLSFEANGEVFTLSAAERDGRCYLMKEGTDLVYEVAKELVAPWLSLTLFELRDHAVLSLPADSFSALTASGGAEGSVLITRTVDKEGSTEEKTAYSYKAALPDGSSVGYDSFKTFLSKLIRTLVTEEADPLLPEGEPKLKLVLSRFEGEEIELAFYPAGQRRVCAVRNAQVLGLIREDVYTELYKSLCALLGEEN